MENIEKLLKKVEKNYSIKNKRETTQFDVGGETYEVLLPTRGEVAAIIFSKKIKGNETLKDLYDWLKPHIYKMFQLKELAVASIEAGFIKTHYEIIDTLFNADEIAKIIAFIMEKINPNDFLDKEIEFQKKQ